MQDDVPAADRTVTFFGPHPGVGGAAIPLPVIVKRVADALDGQTLKLGAALACLQAVAPGAVYADEPRGAILMRMGDTPPMHLWRVIRFR